MDFKKMLDFFFDFQRKKNIKRCSVCPPIFHEFVACHCGTMLDMADELIELLELDLDYKSVMRIIKYHDICEIGMKEDYSAAVAAVCADYRREKKEAENKTIKRLANKHGKKIADYFNEYENQNTQEAKFVKALDKLDSNFWSLLRGFNNYKGFKPHYTRNQELAMEATYAKKAVEHFPAIQPFYREVQEHIKKHFFDKKLKWKNDFFLSQPNSENKFQKTIDLFLDFQKKKTVKRYPSVDKIFIDSVSAHCSAMFDMADELIEVLELELDYKRVVRLIKYHDFCEIGMVTDFDMMDTAQNSNLKAQKEKAETDKIEELANKYGIHIKDYFYEFEEQKTAEARFVKALDRLDAWLHCLERGAQYHTKKQALFGMNKNREIMQNFSPIIPFYKYIQAFSIKEYKEKLGVEFPIECLIG